MTAPTRVLLVGVEKGAPKAAALETADLEGTALADPDAAVEHRSTERADCAIVVDDPPRVDGVAVVDTLAGDLPAVLATDDPSRASEALATGTTDWMATAALESDPDLVCHRLERAIRADRAGPGGGSGDVAGYERIIEGVGDTLYATDADGEFTHMNPAGARISGYDIDRILAEGPALLYDEENLALFDEAIAELYYGDEAVARVEAELETKSGDLVPIESTLTLRRNADGTFAGTIGVARDMTARKERERELREYETIVQALPDEVAILDTEGFFTRLIPPAGEDTGTSGYAPEELEGEHVSTVMTDKDLEEGAEYIADLVTTDRERAAFEMQVVGKDGETHWREDHMALLEGPDGDIQGTVSVLRDIEDRRARERELERYARLIEASGDAVYALDAEGRFTFSNESHQEIVDRPEAEVLGEHASIALPPEAVEDGEALIRELLESGRRNGTFEMDVLRPDGERIPTENHVALLTDEDGEFRGTVGVLRDISERQAREQELERQNERLERFAEIASHDLRNPLNVAQGYLELIESDGEPVERVGDALDRMERLIDDTLAMARQGASVDEQTTVDLATLVPDCWDVVGSETGSIEVAENLAVRADEGRLRQVLENLLRNAVEHGSTSPPSQSRGDAVEHGGEDVTVRIGAIDGEGGGDGRTVGFYVEDDGPGIPAAEREAVFEAGHTGASDGTGFGLAIVAEVVEAHGWEIRVTESEVGGARFEITGVDVLKRGAAAECQFKD